MSKKVRTFLWNVSNGLVGIGITHITKTDYIYAPLIIAGISLFTKEANKAFNPNYTK